MAFRMHEIQELIQLIDQSSIHELELEKDGEKIVLRKAEPRVVTENIVTTVAPAVESLSNPVVLPTAVKETPVTSAPVEEAIDETLHKITSPMVGTFYRSPSPDSDPYVGEGDIVNSKSVVCIVEAMKLMNQLEAEVSGTIVKVLAENGQLVDYGQPLFLVKPS